MGNAMSAKPGPKGDTGPRGPVGPPGEPGIPDINKTIDSLLELDKRFIEPLTKRLGKDSNLAESVSAYLMENLDDFEDRVANKIQITPSIKQDLTEDLRKNSKFISDVSESILGNTITKGILESKITGENSDFKNKVADVLVNKYKDDLRGRPGDIADLDSLKATMTPRTMWCADGDIYCEIPKVSGETRNLKEIVVSNVNKSSKATNFSRWKVTANDNTNFNEFNEYHIVPFLGKNKEGTNIPTGYKSDKAVKIKYRGDPETTELHVPGKIESKELITNDNGIISNIKFSKGWTNFPASATDTSEISNDTGNYKKLMVVGNRSAGGSRQVGIWDDLTVNGKLTVNGDIEIKPGHKINFNSGSDGASIYFEKIDDNDNKHRLIIETRDDNDEPVIHRQRHHRGGITDLEFSMLSPDGHNNNGQWVQLRSAVNQCVDTGSNGQKCNWANGYRRFKIVKVPNAYQKKS